MDNNNNRKRNGWGPLLRWVKNVGGFALLLGLGVHYGVGKEALKRDLQMIAARDSIQNKLIQQLVMIQVQQDSTFTEFRIRFQLAYPALERRVQYRLRLMVDSARADSSQ